jgi:hypothetical protein
MKKIKLSGREAAVLRAIDFATGTPGGDIIERTHIELDDLVDIVNGLMDVGYVETNPALQKVAATQLPATIFDVNPAYAHDLKAALLRR